MKTRLKFLDRYLTLWIFLAMGIGVALGYGVDGFADGINELSVGTTNIPLAIGLILMMYPPLAKVDFAKIPSVLSNPKLLISSFIITWIVGPLLMFLLAVNLLSGYPEYITGLIIIGLAPCIAMVIVWSELAQGNRELTAGLVGINSLLQVFFFSAYAYFYLEIVAPWWGIPGLSLDITFWEIAKTVGLYLGIPFAAAVISRWVLIRSKGMEWFNRKYLPVVSPITLIALLLTIVIMFALKGETLISLPLDVLRVALPLVIFFVVMFFLMFWLSRKLGVSYADAASVSFTASGNNFELAIAVSIGVFGLNSGQAFAGVIGPLVEVPALILLVKAAYWLKNKWWK
jgi:ACR3 family arsenite transporter